MTRTELAASIRELPQDEKLDLLSELWDALDHSEPVPDWHKQELDRRLARADEGASSSWAEAKARILGSSEPGSSRRGGGRHPGGLPQSDGGNA